ncbi:unnamed protein product, partial [Heterosigma akashiwo]
TSYSPASTEHYLLSHKDELGYEKSGSEYGSACEIWAKELPIANVLKSYISELDMYNQAVRHFAPVEDIRPLLSECPCASLEVNGTGLINLFHSRQLSKTSSGFVEPLLPPMRHPKLCFNKRELMSLDYLVHDFAEMCKGLEATSRTVFIDIGASIFFHKGGINPALSLVNLYAKFGFKFDHVYAYEITRTEPEELFKHLPSELFAAYHWINVGVELDPSSKLNPWRMVRENYNENDFVVVKLDIDTPALEHALVIQLLEDDETGKLIDQFYFEHHVNVKEMRRYWRKNTDGSIYSSLKLFSDLRGKNIPAHFWV